MLQELTLLVLGLRLALITVVTASAIDATGAPADDSAAADVGASAASPSPITYTLSLASTTYSLAVLSVLSPLPLRWHLPAHCAATLALSAYSHRTCAGVLLQSAPTQQLFRRLQAALRPLQLLVPVPLPAPLLTDPASICSASITWIKVFFGFLVPTYMRLRKEVAVVVKAAHQRGQPLPPPDRDWGTWFFCGCHRLLQRVEGGLGAQLQLWLTAGGLVWLLCSLVYW